MGMVEEVLSLLWLPPIVLLVLSVEPWLLADVPEVLRVDAVLVLDELDVAGVAAVLLVLLVLVGLDVV
eukprot:3008330-Amphidinium_carterae.1